MLRLFALYENLTRLVSPWCTAAPDRPFYPGTPITQGNNLIDVGGMGPRQFWALKSHLQDSSQLATAVYPETLDRIFVGLPLHHRLVPLGLGARAASGRATNRTCSKTVADPA